MSYQAVCRDDVNAMLAGWRLRVEDDCQIATKGVENTNIMVSSGGGRWVLRLYRSSSFAGARREADILGHLRARGFPVPGMVPDCYGDHITSVAGYPAALLSFLPGEDLEGGTIPAALAREIGDLIGRVDLELAKLPAALSGPAPPHELTSLETTKQRLSACDGRASIPWALVRARLCDLESEARAWRGLPRQLIHGDVSGQNLLADGGRGHVTGLLDFGDVTTSPRVADIAVAICHLGFAGGRVQPEICRALWQGWCRVVSPSPAEHAALASLMASRFIKLVVDHVWRECHGRHHPGHETLIATGINGLRALYETAAPGLAA
jgi:homoserine kinase type II